MRKTPTSPDLRWIGIALLLGTSAGGLAAYGGLPLPWMLGPMIGCTLAALAGMPLVAPGGLRQFVIPVIGVFLGASFHGDMLEQAASWGITAALLPLFCIAAATISYAVYRMIGRYDPITAFFSAMPGGLSEMMLLGDDAGGDGRLDACVGAHPKLSLEQKSLVDDRVREALNRGPSRVDQVGLSCAEWGS